MFGHTPKILFGDLFALDDSRTRRVPITGFSL